jgi:hypothetical protein
VAWLRTGVICILLTGFGCVTPTATYAAEPCAIVSLIESSPDIGPHGVLADDYYSCATSADPTSLRAFNLYSNAAREYTAAAKEFEGGDSIVPFLLYAKSYDTYRWTLVLNKRDGYGDRATILALMNAMAEAIRRSAKIALPRL